MSRVSQTLKCYESVYDEEIGSEVPSSVISFVENILNGNFPLFILSIR